MKSFSPTASRRLVLKTGVATGFGLMMGRPLLSGAADAAMRVRMEKYWDANS
jgi:hypothetical protein